VTTDVHTTLARHDFFFSSSSFACLKNNNLLCLAILKFPPPFSNIVKSAIEVGFLEFKTLIFTRRVCLDGGFKRGREGRAYFSFLNYGHYKMIFRKLN